MSLKLGVGIGVPFGDQRRGSAFSPDQDSALRYWGDASGRAVQTLFTNTAGTTPATTDGAAIARLNDRGPYGYNATQATSGSRPALRLGVQNGLNMIEGDGSNDYLDYVGAVASTTAMTVYVVARVIRTSFPGPANSLDTIFSTGDSGNVSYGGCSYNWYGDPNNNRWSTDVPCKSNGTINGASVTIPQTISNSVASYIFTASYSSAPTSNTGLRLFMYRNGILPGKVQLGELIIVDRTDDVAAQQRYINYLNSIWSVF